MMVPIGPAVPRRGNAFSRGVGRFVLSGMGWRLEGVVPNVPRCVAIVAPHTSNWDFVVGLAADLALGLRVRFLAKDKLFRRPLGTLLTWIGGLPVDRATPDGVVAQAVSLLRELEPFVLALAPEGTRKRVERWKTGFHRIALGAGVPIWPVSLDYRTRILRLHPAFEPSGDLEADLARLQSQYEPGMARYPEHYGVPSGPADRVTPRSSEPPAAPRSSPS
jgi:1-acyl-sn-glycerol-3-phosphate acyltransferase